MGPRSKPEFNRPTILGDLSSADMPPINFLQPGQQEKADALIRADRCIKIDELASELRVRYGRVHVINESRGYSEACAPWYTKTCDR